jgi:hypothetical protein
LSRQDSKSDARLKIINGKEIYNAIYDSINHHLDSLEKSVPGGILFFRMELKSNGFTNIRCSESEPTFLIDLISGALRPQQVKIENVSFDNYDFLLPVIYNFQMSIPTASELLNKVAKIDLSTLGVPKVTGFKKLFMVDDSSALYGVECVFLPWITLSGRTY